MSEQDEVNEQARLNGMGAERELALMAKVEAATRARQQAQEALYAERDRHAATVKKMQADLEMRTDESVRYRGVLDATVIVIEEMRQEIESLQAGSGEVVAWQASDGGHSFISHRTHTTNPDYRAVYTIPLCVATPQPEPAALAAPVAVCRSQNETCAPQTGLSLVAAPQEWSPAYTRGQARQSAPVAAVPALVPMHSEAVGELAEKYAYRDFTNDYPQTIDDLVRDVEAHHGIGLTVGDGGAYAK